MSEFLGARISLISRSDIRYVGILHEINSEESTVSLENVKSFGTEGRKGKPEEEVAPSDQVYEYIVFRGTDVKDLRIEEGPSQVKENQPPPVPNDPAILGARARPTSKPASTLAAQHGSAQGPPGGRLGGPPSGHSGPPPGPPGATGFGYYPPHMGGWGRSNGPGPNGFGGMPYPPPPGWFPPGQEHLPMGPGLWNNFAYPPGPGGPPGMPGTNSRQPSDSKIPNQAQASVAPKPSPIGASSEQKAPTAVQQQKPSDSEPVTQTPAQPPTPSAPPPPVESKPSVEEVKATAAALAKDAGAQDVGKTIPTGPRGARSGPIQPAVPLPTALTAKSEQQTISAAAVTKEVNAANLRDATQVAKAAVAMAMAQLENAGSSLVTNGNAVDNLTRKVDEMRVSATRGGPNNQRNGGRGRGPRTTKVEVPDSDFDFQSSNAKFNKGDLVKEAIAGSPLGEALNGAPEPTGDLTDAPPMTVPTAYNKSRSFFDNISSEAKERAENNRQKPGGREWRGEEQRKNLETFGQSSVDGGYRGYRGRGRGRGVRGRGYSRGRGGGGYRQNQSQNLQLVPQK